MIFHHQFEPFYFMGRRDVQRGGVHDQRPVGWCAKEWFAYNDGVHEEWADMNPADDLLWFGDHPID